MALRVPCRPASGILLNYVSVFRAQSLFSSSSRQSPYVEVKLFSSRSNSDWPDTRLGVLEPAIKRFPLPGFVGRANKTAGKAATKVKSGYDSDLLTEELAHERQSSVLEQFTALNEPDSESGGGASLPFKGADEFVFLATECPQLLIRDFLDLFPNQNAHTARNLTVLVLCRKKSEAESNKTVEKAKLTSGKPSDVESAVDEFNLKNKSGDSATSKRCSNDVPLGPSAELRSSVASGRDLRGSMGLEGSSLLERTVTQSVVQSALAEDSRVSETFIEVASDLCQMLHSVGHWADFIDPTSGRPYIGDNLVGVSSYEVDARYRQLGFEIFSQGSCKVLSHHVRGSRPYVGCLFTSAPPSHPLIKGLLDSSN